MTTQVGGAHYLSETAVEAPVDSEDVQGTQEAVVVVHARYTLHASGRLDVTMDVDASNALPAPLPVALFR